MVSLTHLEGSPVQKRRSDRLFIGIPLSILGTDQKGHEFSDRAVTQTVARFGASIVTKLSLYPEQELTLVPAGKKRIRARVIGQTSIGPEGNVYGIAFLDTTIDVWGIYFPPVAETTRTSVHLECCKCHTRENVRLSELEFDVFRANDRLKRICTECGDATTWRLATPVLERKPPQPSREARPEGREPGQQQHSEPPPSAEAANAETMQLQRRLHPRVRMNMKACIVQPGSDSDIVTTINMSRGGILVRSERIYSTESWIQLAVPYTPAAANIFVPARIIWRADVSGGYQYGIKYVRP